jgi:hypothetical protein
MILKDPSKFHHTFVICTKDRPLDLFSLLKSVNQQSQQPYKIIIVDSGDLPPKNLSFISSSFQYIRSEPGLTHQRNIALSLIFENEDRSEIIHFVDDDVTLDINYLKMCDEVFSENESIFGCTGLDLNRFESKKLFAKSIKLVLGKVLKISGIMTRSAINIGIYNFDYAYEVDWMPGCNMIFRKSVLHNKEFNEFRMGYGLGEDVEFTYGISRNHKLIFSPKIKYRHHLSAINRIKSSDLVKKVYLHKLYMAYLFPNDFSLAQIKILQKIFSIRALL